MNVNINYIDRDSFTGEEIRTQAKRLFGSSASVSVTPESSRLEDYLYFAIQGMITTDQVSMYFDDKDKYPQDLQKLRLEVSAKMQEVLDRVIVDNELRITRE